MPTLLPHLRPRRGKAVRPMSGRPFHFGGKDRPRADEAATASPYTAENSTLPTVDTLLIGTYLAYSQNACVEDVLADLRTHSERYAHYDVQYAYVVAPDGKLVGVLRLRDLLLSPPARPIALIMISDPIHVDCGVSLEELKQVFDRHSLLGIPVTDEQRRLVGIVRRIDVEKACEERANRALLTFLGILGGEELRSMPFRQRSLRRLSWLVVNIFLNAMAASVIAWHQETLSAFISLAVFLPIISDMSGCSGNQAVAVSMRELMLGAARPNQFLRVLRKEIGVGLFNGLMLGLLLGGLALLWKGNPALGLVVGAALTLNTMVAVCLGGTIPLLLRMLRQDPALASGPILTTVTDMCGFFFVLSFAQIAMPWMTRF